MNSIKLWNRMDTKFMNSENIKTSDLHRLSLNLADKINLSRSDKYVALWNLTIYYTWKNIKKSYKNNISKISAPTWNEEYKKHETIIGNISIMIYVNKIEKRIKFKVKTEYYLDLLTP